MLARARSLLPHGPVDLLRQLVLFCGAYWLYRLVRGIVDGRAVEAYDNAREVINIERGLGLTLTSNRPGRTTVSVKNSGSSAVSTP